MRRSENTLIILAICPILFALGASFPQGLSAQDTTASRPSALPDIFSGPPDTNNYSRPAIPEDYSPFGYSPLLAPTLVPSIFVVDPAVNNTVPNFLNTDTQGGSEPSIAIDPLNPNQIVMLSFSFGWGANATLWLSTDGGVTWTEESTIPKPPGDPGGGPNDQTPDYGRAGILYGAFLSCFSNAVVNGCNVYSGQSGNPASAAAWSWFAPGGIAQTSNTNNPASYFSTDQPWLLVNRDPTTPGQDNTYVAYDNGVNMRVAVSLGANPPNFTVDNQSGTAGGAVNPGHRLAADPRTGWMYSLFQSNTVGLTIDYRLNRSLDAGSTWTLNGAAGGIIVATADSDQLNSIKFGTVNDLRGGVLHAAADPGSGDLYYVYGNRDAGTKNNRLAIRRITFNNVTTNAVVGAEVFVTGQVQAALPSVAVTSDGTVGVLYDTFDGFTSDGFPIFSAHFSVSADQAMTFTDYVLETFLSPAKDSCTNSPTNCGDKQRVFGDYQQVKAVGRAFYGVFSGNRAPFGGTQSIIDPIFFKVSFGPQIQVPGSVTVADTCVGSTNTATLNVCNTGDQDLQVTQISSSDPEFVAVSPSSGYPVIISPDFCFPFQVRFAPTSVGSKASILTISSNDPRNPSTTVSAVGNGTLQAIATVIANGGRFGDVCIGTYKDLDLTINNSGGCDLKIFNITSSDPEFTAPTVSVFPLVVQAGTSVHVPIRLTPTSLGIKSANITITSNDPNTPSKVIMVSGNTPPGSLRLTGSTVFGDVCAGAVAEKQIAVCNVGTCNLNVSSAAFVPPCPDFTLINNPFPAAVSPDSCQNLTVRFTPTSCGAKSCTLQIVTDDPNALTNTLTVTANAPCASADVPPNQCFPPTVIQSVGACLSSEPFPISNTGTCPLKITAITLGGANPAAYEFIGLPSFPIILEQGHIVGEGNFKIGFIPTVLARNTLATISVTYESDPVTHATTTVTRTLNGEGVRTGARVLVLNSNTGVPLAKVEKIMIQRITGNRNKNLLNTVDSAMNLAPVTVTPALPCGPFQYHREYSTVSNAIQLLPGSYQITATAYVGTKKYTKAIGFDVTTCTFNPNIVISLP
jgi:hypothetical protein